MKRRQTLKLGLATGAAGLGLGLPALGALAASASGAPAGQKVLRVVFPVAETGFDPVVLSDIYSRTVTAHIFEAPFDYDHLARPVKIRPRTAAGPAEHADDYKLWTVRLRSGIHFADDPAFKGAKRELVAQDYVYTLKRFADPANKSPAWTSFEEMTLIGLRELREQALKNKAPFNYDTEIEGLRALDRHTLQFRLEKGDPRFAEKLADGGLMGAVAREVVEFYGDKIAEHPVGTGPYRLAGWRRSSQIVLERNANFRPEPWYAEPAADDAEGQAILQRMKGKLVPLVDRVEIAIIEESQPRWLSFMNAQIDILAVPPDFATLGMPGGKLAPNLRRRGVQAWRVLVPFTQLCMFNMDNPVVGGLEPAQVALRRAIGLGMDLEREIRMVYRGQAIPAQSIIQPHTTGFNTTFRSENSQYSPARARGLLETYGFVDKNGDGWRERPNGEPLLLEVATQPDGLSRQLDELFKRDMDRLGIKVEFKPAKWPENLKAARGGKYMMWRVGTSASVTDGQEVLQRLYGPQVGNANLARFKLPAFDRVYDEMKRLPDGPEREALFEQAKRLSIAYSPYKVRLHQYADVLAHPWVHGYRRPLFWNHFWHMVDVDMSHRPAA